VGMARRVSLQPCASGLKKWPWRVNLPANISSSGKRERRFFERITPYGVTLNTVIGEFIERQQAIARSVTFEELFDRFTAFKKSRSAAYLRDLK
jgi:hypothetical protein